MVLPSNEDKTVKEALHLIDQGWVHLHSKVKQNVVFVLGGTGHGKSTVTEIVTGDLTKLHSIPGQHGTGLVIVDEIPEGSSEGRIGDPQVSSKTFLPEYLTSRDDPSLVFVDCPGFNDNRGTHMDIAAMVLIRKIAEQVNNVRFLFVVPYSSVSYSNMQRNDFLSLCSHATSFIRDIDKVKDSMCLVITKVNNCDPASGRKIEDHVVKKEAKHFLKEVAYHPSTSEENKMFVKYLLKDDSKWALMRYPSEEGPLSGIAHFPEVRKEILEICRSKLKGAVVNGNDFSVTISSDSKYIIRKRLIPCMKEEIDKIMESLVKIMQVGYVTRVESQLKTQRTSELVGTVRKLGDSCEKLRGQEINISNSSSSAVGRVCEAAQWLDIRLPEMEMEKLKKIEEQFKLFGYITEESDMEMMGTSVQITVLFGNLRSSLQDLYKETLKSLRENNVPNVEIKIKEQGDKNIKHFEWSYKIDIYSLLEKDDGCRGALDKLHLDWNTLEQLDKEGGVCGKPSKVITKIWAAIQTGVNHELLDELMGYENELDMLLELIDQKTGYFNSEALNILVKVRNAVGEVRSEIHQQVREEHVKFVHEKVGSATASMIGSLEEAFFQESFYPGLDITTLALRRQVLASAHYQLQQSRGRFNGVLENVREVFRIFGVEIPGKGERLLGKCEELLNFYDERLGSPIARPMDDWMSCIRSFSDRIRDMDIFYEFLELSKNASSGILADFEVYEIDDRETVVAKFLDVFRASSEIRRVVEQRAGFKEISLIVELVTYLQNGRTKVQRDGLDKMIVKGRHVKFSDFVTENGEIPEIDSVKKLVILASESVHFDRDLRATGKELSVVVIADKWVVKGIQRNIHLSGSCGLDPKEPKAKSGVEFGESGSCGEPGNCGGNGGNFLGIYREVENSKSLCIYANGGNGGDGQDGGDGFRGKEIRKRCGVSGFLGILAGFPTFPSVGGADTVCGGGGGEEEQGGNGGHGGVGGLPGFAGSIKLYGVGEETAVLGSICFSDGEPGKPGKGGVGGRGGRHDGGLGIASILKQGIVQNFPGGNGMNGLDGRNVKGQCFPKTSQSTNELDWRNVEEFQKYVEEECPGSSVGEKLLKLIGSYHNGMLNNR